MNMEVEKWLITTNKIELCAIILRRISTASAEDNDNKGNEINDRWNY